MADLSDPEILCERCNQMNLENLKGAYGCVHQPSFKALVDSASSCKLCKLIAEACIHYLGRNRVEANAKTGHLGPVRLFATDRKDSFFRNGAANPRSTSRRATVSKSSCDCGQIATSFVYKPVLVNTA